MNRQENLSHSTVEAVDTVGFDITYLMITL